MPYLGAHTSVAGGLHHAFTHLATIGGQALQIFSANQRRWQVKPLTKEGVAQFKEKWVESGCPPIASHASYLINLGSAKPETVNKSITALVDEFHRCEALSIPWVVLHPGSHGGDGVEAGLVRVVQNLDRVFEQLETPPIVTLLLENTAGQGTGLGSQFNELGTIIQESAYREQLGVCFDTCHAFAAGYDFRTAEQYATMMTAFDQLIGKERLHFFHLNDSKKGLGSRVDRHEHIGQGEIGIEGFRQLLNDPDFAEHPMALETPKSDDLHEDRENLAVLHRLIATTD